MFTKEELEWIYETADTACDHGVVMYGDYEKAGHMLKRIEEELIMKDNYGVQRNAAE